MTNHLYFAENPIRFGSVVTKKYELLKGMSLVPSIQILTASRLTQHNELWISHYILYGIYADYVQTWKEGTHDKHNINSYFFVSN